MLCLSSLFINKAMLSVIQSTRIKTKYRRKYILRLPNTYLHFVCDKDIMIASLIQSGELPVGLKNTLWDKYRKEYNLLHDNVLNAKKKDFDRRILDEVKNSEAFQGLEEETKKRAEEIEMANNYDIVIFVQDMITFSHSINMEEQTVYLVPGHRGTNLGNNQILWGVGHGQGINYDLVYIWHEALHSYFRPLERQCNDTKREISHCIIQLMCEHELNFMLNHTHTPLPTHSELDTLMLQIIPYFYAYLGLKDSYIRLRNKAINFSYNIKNFSKYKDMFKDFDLAQFYFWLIEHQDELNKTITRRLQ